MPFTIRLFVPASGSLLEIVRVEYVVTAEVGVKVTVTSWLAPAFTIKFVVEIVNCPSLEVMFVTDKLLVPSFSIVIVRVPDVPISVEPI